MRSWQLHNSNNRKRVGKRDQIKLVGKHFFMVWRYEGNAGLIGVFHIIRYPIKFISTSVQYVGDIIGIYTKG